ncbi:thioesterase II family protein [Pseudonocardia alaniniphila]|uniref:Alpha/beta fold hydrolase n=1 Tax=Pseudonocardia alaniniphila TaxID=75291 RepID=A0ABS9T979_9PSEU|nr:alpha/beta fold hydrolase [Pseudonocardia alaniniphila]MCH6165092.1 alpha/beta fold hydrolase [Pseudonocardia alaniniphila]
MPQDAERRQWARVFHPAPDAPVRLVCFPHAGGTASYFGPLARASAPAVEVTAIQYPGRQDRFREPCLSSVDELADAVVGPMTAADDRPVALFGHSLGASVAFEVACRLEGLGRAPLAVFVSGRRAPSRPRDDSVHSLGDDALVAEIGKLGGTDPRVLAEKELLRLALPAVRADFRAAETYRWRGSGPISSPLHVHVGDDDPRVTEDEARAWAAHTTGICTLTRHPGGHFYLDSRTDQVLAAIRHELFSRAPSDRIPPRSST